MALPWQIVVADGVGVAGVPTVGVTVILTILDVAGLPVAQVAFEVITQVTASLFASVVVV